MTKPSSSRKRTETTVDEARKATVPNSVDRIGIAAANSAERRAAKPRRLLMASTFKPVPAVPTEIASPMHSATMIPVVASSIPCPRLRNGALPAHRTDLAYATSDTHQLQLTQRGSSKNTKTEQGRVG